MKCRDCTIYVAKTKISTFALSRIGELIVYRSRWRLCVSVCVHACVNTFKHEYLCNQMADCNEILSEASLGWGKGFSRF